MFPGSLASAGRSLPERLARPDPLRWHATLAATAAAAAVLANVLWSPGRIWAPWLALALGAALAAHGWVVLARALRPSVDPQRESSGLGARTGPTSAPGAVRIDPGPPIFPPAPPRRWIPRPLDEPAPAPRVAVSAAPRLRSLPERWLEDVEIGPARTAPAWPTWEPLPAPAAHAGWSPDDGFAGEPAAGPEPAHAGW